MIIYIHSKLAKHSKIMKRLEEEFGGITQDKPDFEVSSTDECLVNVVGGNEYDSASYYQSVIRFLETHFPKTLKSV